VLAVLADKSFPRGEGESVSNTCMPKIKSRAREPSATVVAKPRDDCVFINFF
jgi:hypothetical protein